MNLSKETKAVLASYGRSVLGAATALYMTGVTDPKTLAYSLLGAIVPVVLRAINPNDTAFGRLPSVKEVDLALKTTKVVKKKAAPKKPAAKKDTKKGK